MALARRPDLTTRSPRRFVYLDSRRRVRSAFSPSGRLSQLKTTTSRGRFVLRLSFFNTGHAALRASVRSEARLPDQHHDRVGPLWRMRDGHCASLRWATDVGRRIATAPTYGGLARPSHNQQPGVTRFSTGTTVTESGHLQEQITSHSWRSLTWRKPESTSVGSF